MLLRTGHRVRWLLVWGSLAVWFVALALDIGGNAVHLVLVLAVLVLVYELLVDDPPPA